MRRIKAGSIEGERLVFEAGIEKLSGEIHTAGHCSPVAVGAPGRRALGVPRRWLGALLLAVAAPSEVVTGSLQNARRLPPCARPGLGRLSRRRGRPRRRPPSASRQLSGPGRANPAAGDRHLGPPRAVAPSGAIRRGAAGPRARLARPRGSCRGPSDTRAQPHRVQQTASNGVRADRMSALKGGWGTGLARAPRP